LTGTDRFGREIYLSQRQTDLAGIYLSQGQTGLAREFTFDRDRHVWQGDLTFTGTDRFGRDLPFTGTDRLSRDLPLKGTDRFGREIYLSQGQTS